MVLLVQMLVPVSLKVAVVLVVGVDGGVVVVEVIKEAVVFAICLD